MQSAKILPVLPMLCVTSIFGQGIYINRKENVVIALHSARPVASNDLDWAWQNGLYTAITAAVKN